MSKEHNMDMPISAIKQPEYKAESFFDYLISKFKNIKPNLAVLNLHGVIAPKGSSVGFKGSSISLEDLNDNIEKAFALPRLKAVLLSINSPGGSPAQSELITRKINLLKKQKNVKVYAFIEDIAASGGYWLSCVADEVYALKSSIIGSIGVITQGFGFQDAMEKLGLQRRVYTSGKSKNFLDPFLPTNEDDIEFLKKQLNIIHEHFIDHVKFHRKNRLNQSDSILFEGKFWTGEVAKDYGLIDGIDDMNSFIDEKFGKDVNIEYIKPKSSWIKQKLGLESFNINLSIEDFKKHFNIM
jgi:signal peptide peptidase SppA